MAATAMWAGEEAEEERIPEAARRATAEPAESAEAEAEADPEGLQELRL